MESFIVTIRNGSRYYDLQLPADMPAKSLADKVIAFFRNYDSEFIRQTAGQKIKVESIGRCLDDDETLEEAGIWDGNIITLL